MERRVYSLNSQSKNSSVGKSWRQREAREEPCASRRAWPWGRERTSPRVRARKEEGEVQERDLARARREAREEGGEEKEEEADCREELLRLLHD